MYITSDFVNLCICMNIFMNRHHAKLSQRLPMETKRVLLFDFEALLLQNNTYFAKVATAQTGKS